MITVKNEGKKETKVIKGDLFFVQNFSFVSFLVQKMFPRGEGGFCDLKKFWGG